MRKMRCVLSVVILIPFLLFSACKKKENAAPTCEIENPADGARVLQGDRVPVVVNADDKDGAITELRSFIDGELTGQTDQSSLTYEWNTSSAEVGMHVVSAIATDDGDKAVTVNHDVLVDTEGGFNPDLTYGTVTDIDGNNYGTIAIGDQVWMAGNLKVTRYSDGSDIPMVTGESEWAALDIDGKAWSWYENLAEYGDTSGALYTWAAVMNGAASSEAIPSGVQGVCPAGWHLPSDAEWKILEM